MPRYKLTVAYDGTHFHGWQKQQPSDESSGMVDSGDPQPGAETSVLRTAQEVLEQAVRRVVREPVTIIGASRTDSGVHARGQVAAFTAQAVFPVEKLPRALSARLPDDMQVTAAEIVHDEFDPIKDAIAKGYRYRIAHGCARDRQPLLGRHYIASTHYRLDPALMNEAARRLLGEHDFASFARISHGRLSTVRTIYECKVTARGRRRCDLDIAGNGFLYNMVRIIAGTLWEVGRGRIPPDEIVRILAARDRNAAGPTLPPHGLCLMWVRYPESGAASVSLLTPARPA